MNIFGLGISNVSGTALYWTDMAPHNLQNNAWGSSLLRWASGMDKGHTDAVTTVELRALISRLLLPLSHTGQQHEATRRGGLVEGDRRRQLVASSHVVRRRGRQPTSPSLPPPPLTATVGMKMDCEGCEYDALPPAIDSLCASVDVLWLERHDRFFSHRWRGHKAGFESEGRVEKLDASSLEIGRRRNQGRCRTAVRQLTTIERSRAQHK